jgi:hypothetical protein
MGFNLKRLVLNRAELTQGQITQPTENPKKFNHRPLRDRVPVLVWSTPEAHISSVRPRSPMEPSTPLNTRQNGSSGYLEIKLDETDVVYADYYSVAAKKAFDSVTSTLVIVPGALRPIQSYQIHTLSHKIVFMQEIPEQPIFTPSLWTPFMMLRRGNIILLSVTYQHHQIL